MAILKNIQPENILKGNLSVAKILGVSVVAVSNMISRDELNYKRVGRNNYFDKTNLFAEQRSRSKRKQNA